MICGTIAALASLAGAGMQAAAAQQAQEAASQATREELNRQQGYRKEAMSTFADSLKQSTPAKAQQAIDEGAQTRQADYAKARSVPLTEGRTPYTSGEGSRLLSSAGAASQDHLGDAMRARLGGYTDWDLKQAIKDMRASQALGTIGSFSQGSQNVLPLELQSAAHSGDTLAGLGQLFSTAGMLGSAYGAFAKAPVSAAAQAANANPVVLGSLANPSPTGMWGQAALGLPAAPYYNFFTGR